MCPLVHWLKQAVKWLQESFTFKRTSKQQQTVQIYISICPFMNCLKSGTAGPCPCNILQCTVNQTLMVFFLCPISRRKDTQSLDITQCTHCLWRKQLYLPWLNEKSSGLFSSAFYFFSFNICVSPLNCNLFLKCLCQFQIQVWKHFTYWIHTLRRRPRHLLIPFETLSWT